MLSRNCMITTVLTLSFVYHVRCRDAPIVDIPDQGQISGHFFTMFRTQKIVGYLGIPYAMPPIGDRRFSPPTVGDLPPWQGVRNGSQPSLQCWSDTRKPIKNHDEIFYKILNIDPKAANSSQFSEDCLYLNIYVPDGKQATQTNIFIFTFTGLQNNVHTLFGLRKSICFTRVHQR